MYAPRDHPVWYDVEMEEEKERLFIISYGRLSLKPQTDCYTDIYGGIDRAIAIAHKEVDGQPGRIQTIYELVPVKVVTAGQTPITVEDVR